MPRLNETEYFCPTCGNVWMVPTKIIGKTTQVFCYQDHKNHQRRIMKKREDE